MLLQRRVLAHVPLVHPALQGVQASLRRADDLYVSLCIARGRGGRHLVPGVLGRRWRDLPTHGVGLQGQPGHFTERGQVVGRMLAYYEQTGEPQ
jgi:hypothetical protein